MTDQEIRKQLGDRNLAEVGRRLKVTRSWLQQIRAGNVPISQNMRERLERYFAEN